MFYVLDENNNKIEAFDKLGVLNAIETAIADGSLANLVADAAFVNKFKCCVSGQTNFMGFITQSKYNEMLASGEIPENSCLFITDDNETECFEEQFNELVKMVNQLTTGETVVANARMVNNVVITQDENGVIRVWDKIIPQKKLVWSGSLKIDGVVGVDVDTTNGKTTGNVYEVEISDSYYKFALHAHTQTEPEIYFNGNGYGLGAFCYEEGGINFAYIDEDTGAAKTTNHRVTKIYQVIE